MTGIRRAGREREGERNGRARSSRRGAPARTPPAARPGRPRSSLRGQRQADIRNGRRRSPARRRAPRASRPRRTQRRSARSPGRRSLRASRNGSGQPRRAQDLLPPSRRYDSRSLCIPSTDSLFQRQMSLKHAPPATCNRNAAPTPARWWPRPCNGSTTPCVGRPTRACCAAFCARRPVCHGRRSPACCANTGPPARSPTGAALRAGRSPAATPAPTSGCWPRPTRCTARCPARPRAPSVRAPGVCSATDASSAWPGSPTANCTTCGARQTCARRRGATPRPTRPDGGRDWGTPPQPFGRPGWTRSIRAISTRSPGRGRGAATTTRWSRARTVPCSGSISATATSPAATPSRSTDSTLSPRPAAARALNHARERPFRSLDPAA